MKSWLELEWELENEKQCKYKQIANRESAFVQLLQVVRMLWRLEERMKFCVKIDLDCKSKSKT